jgi:hypothetical protein
MSVYVGLLFIVLTPGVLLTLPKGGSKLTVALVHGLVFATVYYFTHMYVQDTLYVEGFVTKPKVAPTSKPVVQKTISSFLLDSYIVDNMKKKERAAATAAKKKIKEQAGDE